MTQSRALRYRESLVRTTAYRRGHTLICASCTKDTKHATNNTIPATNQALARRRRSPARTTTTSPCTSRRRILVPQCLAVATSPEHTRRFNTTHTIRSNARSINTTSIIFHEPRLRQRRRATFDRSRDATAYKSSGTRGSICCSAALICCEPCCAAACGWATAETVL